jgi:hypothetical protein
MSLSSEQKSLLEKHMEMNSEARSDFERYQKILAVLEADSEIEPPEDFTCRVMQALPEIDFSSASSSRDAIFERFVRSPLGWVSMAAIFIVVVFSFGKFNPTDHAVPQAREIVIAENPEIESAEQANNEQSVETDASQVGSTSISMSLKVLDGYVFLARVNEGGVNYLKGSEEILRPGNVIRTSQKGSAMIVYSDGKTALNIKPRTELRIIDSNIFHLKQGDVWVEIRKKVDRFEVKTDHLIAAVRGTRFSVSARVVNSASRVPLKSSYSKVNVFEGRVRVRFADKTGAKSSDLELGDGITVKRDDVEVRRLVEGDYLEWDEVQPSKVIEVPKANQEIDPSKAFDR